MKKLNSKLTSNKANYKRLFAMLLIGAFCFNCIRYISAYPGGNRDFKKKVYVVVSDHVNILIVMSAMNVIGLKMIMGI